MKKKLIIFVLFPFLISSCNIPRMNNAYIQQEEWKKANVGAECMNIIDNQISQYNQSHDTAILITTLTDLEANFQELDIYKQFYIERMLTINRLLHKYDSAQSILEKYPDESFGVFGKKMQSLITDISILNYQKQNNDRDQKITELIIYMEYCFERKDSIDCGNEAGFLKKYHNNNYAKESEATPKDYESLSWYVMARLLRGDNKQEIQNKIEMLTKDNITDNITQKMLSNLLTKQIQEIDFDANL